MWLFLSLLLFEFQPLDRSSELAGLKMEITFVEKKNDFKLRAQNNACISIQEA